MKSQDILLLVKIVSMHNALSGKNLDSELFRGGNEWADWEEKGLSPSYTEEDNVERKFSVRNLAEITGISKSQISLSLNRMYDVGLAKTDRKLRVPKVNTRALLDFFAFGLRYVFPAKPAELTRGIATSIAAPVLQGQLMTSGEIPPVWEHPKGNTIKGLKVEPLHPNVFQAISNDRHLYAMLALVDSIRMGNPRERNYSLELLEPLLREAR